MIQKRISDNDNNSLLKDVAFITLLAILFLIIVSKFGGYASDLITKSSCKAVSEKYVAGKKPGDGLCVKTNNNIDVKK